MGFLDGLLTEIGKATGSQMKDAINSQRTGRTMSDKELSEAGRRAIENHDYAKALGYASELKKRN